MDVSREVLNGVGVDGVGVIFPLFTHSPFFTHFSLFFTLFPLLLRFSLLLLKDMGKQQQFTAKMGNFTPTPSAPTPRKTSQILPDIPSLNSVVQFGIWFAVDFMVVLGRVFFELPLKGV